MKFSWFEFLRHESGTKLTPVSCVASCALILQTVPTTTFKNELTSASCAPAFVLSLQHPSYSTHEDTCAPKMSLGVCRPLQCIIADLLIIWRVSMLINNTYIFWSLYKAAKLWSDCATSGWSGPRKDSRISNDRWKNDLAALLWNGEKISCDSHSNYHYSTKLF